MKDFLKLIVPFFYGSDKKYARWGGLLLLVLSQISTSFGYLFIQWNRRFYDALETRDLQSFIKEMIIFASLSLSFVLIYSITRYYGQQFALRWRMWMTNNALAKWLHYEQRGQLEGADQRIQEDLMRFTLIFERFFLDCFNAVLLIILLTPMLFMQTNGMQIMGWSLGFIIFGVSILYTIFGMLISAKIANPLINFEYNNQKLEAELRYNLVHAKDGKQLSHVFFKEMLASISGNYNSIYKNQKNFNLWQKAYDQFSFLIPFILLLGPYFGGLLTLGMLMQIKSTFSRIRNSMSYLLDHYTELTELLAISKRLVEFYKSANINLLDTEVLNPTIPNKLIAE